jgi:4-oxalocrotonate tautomerase family enzyme
MPLVEVKVFKDELPPEQTRALIQKITDAVTSVTSEKLRDVAWVIVSEVPSGNWGTGGAALGLDDVKKLLAGTGPRRLPSRCCGPAELAVPVYATTEGTLSRGL